MSADAILLGRIARLPRKTSLVLAQLYHEGLLSRETLCVLTDMADLSGDGQKLLAFGAVYGDLRAAGVPVADTLSMARRLGVKVNPGWSATRWRTEHDRLARALTLKRLGEENTRYDLSRYDRVIDRPFPGYLIRTSRRLGMEGLRQRHCVASYHDRIKAGYCAIATVFVEGERWTVELRLTGNMAHPLAIGQIRTAFNGAAGDSVRETILGFFNVAMGENDGQRIRETAEDRAYLGNARRLLPVLQEGRVSRVTVSFDGSGDCGSICDVSFDGGDFDAANMTAESLGVARRFDGGRWLTERVAERKSVRSAIEELAYDYIEETGVDWYNNEGGYGELVLDVENGTIALEVNTRFTQSEVAFAAELDIATGYQVE